MEFEVGADVRCTDGSAGKVAALIADPVARALAHIAVEPEHHPGDARLVPVGLVGAASPASVELRCSLAELARLPEFSDIEFVPYVRQYGDLGDSLAWPLPVIVDHVPPGEVEIRRHEQVHAADGAIGRVEGLVVDGEGRITHVLLQEGHFWDRKEVSIPIGSVDKIDADGIHVRLSKQEIEDLPELGVSPPS